jgi:PIN domain nuclease of toxin-antitoxin system
VVYSLTDEEQLSKDVKGIIDNYANEFYISSESIRELMDLFQTKSIGARLWKSKEGIIDYIRNETSFVIKYIKEEHFRTFARMPWFADHKDPRDKMIIAHAMTEKLTLISSDTEFFRYLKHGLDFIHNKKR